MTDIRTIALRNGGRELRLKERYMSQEKRMKQLTVKPEESPVEWRLKGQKR